MARTTTHDAPADLTGLPVDAILADARQRVQDALNATREALREKEAELQPHTSGSTSTSAPSPASTDGP